MITRKLIKRKSNVIGGINPYFQWTYTLSIFGILVYYIYIDIATEENATEIFGKKLFNKAITR